MTNNILSRANVDRVVLSSGLLTFLFCVELCVGVRTICYTFSTPSGADSEQGSSPSWVLRTTSATLGLVSFASVNVLSALWEQKQREERKEAKNSVLFALHCFFGGTLWRYVGLWFADTKQRQREGALLLTMAKFLFTHAFTVPLAVLHASHLDRPQEVAYVASAAFCVSLSLSLTCAVFSWCPGEAEALKKWNRESLELVPLIFGSDSDPAKDGGRKEEDRGLIWEEAALGTLAFLRGMTFALGRLLALGVLVRLAGAYAASIVLLQLLASVLYLKFRGGVKSELLPARKQLPRLAFLAYLLVFDWHLERSPGTSLAKYPRRAAVYYCAAAADSAFYLVAWNVAEAYSSPEPDRERRRLCRSLLVVVVAALLLSLLLHLLLMLLVGSRSFGGALRRRSVRQTKVQEEPSSPRSRVDVDISSPVADRRSNSYRDLRDPVDEDIVVFSRRVWSPGGAREPSKTTSSSDEIGRRSEDSGLESRNESPATVQVEPRVPEATSATEGEAVKEGSIAARVRVLSSAAGERIGKLSSKLSSAKSFVSSKLRRRSDGNGASRTEQTPSPAARKDSSVEGGHSPASEGPSSPCSDGVHRPGDSPCPCYVCRALGEGRFRRRTSCSVPASRRPGEGPRRDSISDVGGKGCSEDAPSAQDEQTVKRVEHYV